MSAYVAFGAATVHVIVGLVTGSLTLRLELAAWASIVGFAVVGTAIAFLLFLRGLAVLGPVRTAIVSTVEPFFTTLLGALVLAQPLPPSTLAGGALIAGAVILLQRRGGTRNDEFNSKVRT
jgi:drug/metabolite transporter (DMT)-like permease